MKPLKIAVYIIITIISAFSVWNKLLLDKCHRQLKQQKAEVVKIRKAFPEIQRAVIKAQSAAMRYLGKKLRLENVAKIFPEDDISCENSKHPRLLLIFSELGCNVCQDDESKFGNDIVSEYGRDYVMAVVQSESLRYAKNYIRLNQVNFPVYYCKEKTFFMDNEIHNTPMVFVIDKETRVIAAHFPIPGHKEYSEPFHLFCHHYFSHYRLY